MNRLARTLYIYAACEDCILLYPVYALLFAGTGLSVSEISSLFVIWTVTGLVLEVPSGAWADAVSRRLLLSVGPLLGAVGFALWVLVPSYRAFALGFVLWGASDALRSGAMEALVYEELDRLGAAAQYARIMGRASAAGVAAVAAATAAATPVFAFGGYLALGTASVLACVLCALAGALLPEHRTRRQRSHSAAADYAAALRAGLAEAKDNRSVRSILLLVAVVTAIWGGLDEYVALLAADTGVATTVVPLLVLIVWVGVTLGGFMSGVGERLPPRAFAGWLAGAALLTAGGAVIRVPLGFVLLGAGFCVFQMAGVVLDARLQDSISGPSRATVTSLAGLGTGVATLLVYGAYAAASPFATHGVIFALLAVPYLGIALVMLRGNVGR